MQVKMFLIKGIEDGEAMVNEWLSQCDNPHIHQVAVASIGERAGILLSIFYT